MIRTLFEQVATPGNLQSLKLVEVLNWAGATLNRVDRAAFFSAFEEGHAVQYFYEPFLKAYDPKLRDELGVWYTPPEIVRYMVARVDTVLRDDLGIEDGLADDRVYVLDPCCGTGTYLIEVLHRIAQTLRAKGDDALLGYELKRAATNRVFGFEILPAPFVVAHLQLGLLLQNAGAPLAGRNERAAVYLTNALTGWLEDKHPPLPFHEFAEERDLSNAYRTTVRAPAPQGQGLNDLYVRFFRMAERRIVERTGRGVVCFISNYSWLDGLSFTGMRETYLDAFDRIWIDNLNGDKFKTGKKTPDGRPDPSIFSTQWNREGIQVGTAITLLLRRQHHQPTRSLLFRDLWGTAKHPELLDSLSVAPATLYTRIEPPLQLGLPFNPAAVSRGYENWPLLPELFPVFFPGVKTSRDDLVVNIDLDSLQRRIGQYFDPAVTDAEMRRLSPSAMEKTVRFDAQAVRVYLQRRGMRQDGYRRYCYRPMDVRWLYWEPETKLLDEKRAEYVPHVVRGNAWLVSQQKPRRDWSQPQVVQSVGCLDLMDRSARFIPLYLTRSGQGSLFDDGAQSALVPNLTPLAQQYIERFSVSASDLFHHVVAILHTPLYRTENAGALRQDWPRIPLPEDRDTLLRSADLGRTLASLLDPERTVAGVTSGQPRRELAPLGALAHVEGRQLNPAADFKVTAHWGYLANGAVMPAVGRALPREYTAEERAAIEAGATRLGMSLERALACLGDSTFDIYLNDRAYWRNVPSAVWRYTLGGYQVIKK